MGAAAGCMGSVTPDRSDTMHGEKKALPCISALKFQDYNIEATGEHMSSC